MTYQATTNKRIPGCGDIHLRHDRESWHNITITKMIDYRTIHAVTDDGVQINLTLDAQPPVIYKIDKLTPVKRKDLKELR